MFFDGDDDDNTEISIPETGDYSLDDDIGERIGEGGDSIEDEIL